MKLAVMQPYLFPYLGYFQLIHAADEFILYDDVQFIKQGWINRNYIQIRGTKHLFTLHLNNASSNRLINEVEIKDNSAKLLKTIQASYVSAPHFPVIYPLAERILSFPESNLARFIHNSLIRLCEYMNISTPIRLSSAVPKDNSLKGQDKIIHICKLMQSDHYINSIGGQELYSKQSFEGENIRLSFLKPGVAEYNQSVQPFVPNLSIIDVLMYNSAEDIRLLLNNYEWVG